MKYKEIYHYGVCQLSDAGIEEKEWDARLLLEYVCHTDRNDLLVHGDREVPESEKDRYFALIEEKACAFAAYYRRTGIYGAGF